MDIVTTGARISPTRLIDEFSQIAVLPPGFGGKGDVVVLVDD